MTTLLPTVLMSLSFFFYLLAKQDLGLPVGTLQALGMLFFILPAVLGWRRSPRMMTPVLLVGCCFLFTGWAITDGPVAGLINAVFILVSFPLALAAAKGLNPRVFFRATVVIIASFCLLGVALGNISVSYIGDSRSERWILGFLRPTFLSEAMTLMVMALYGLRGRTLRSHSVCLVAVAAALAIQIKTGSRAGLGASLLFLYMAWEGGLIRGLKLPVRFATRGAVFLGLIWLAFSELDVDAINSQTTGRLAILMAEVEGNLTRPLHWLLGNFDSHAIFEYSTERAGLVYHIDSFYGERLISSGVVGLAMIGAMIFLFARAGNRMTRAVLSAVLFHGFFENGVFNITSLFSTYTLVFAVLLARLSTLDRKQFLLRRRFRLPLRSEFGARMP